MEISADQIRIFDEETIEELDHCAACGTCHSVCPVYNLTGDDTLSPRGRIHLLNALINDHIEPSAIGRKVFDRCLLCYACETVCPSGVKISRIWIQAREYFARAMGAGIKGMALRTISDGITLNRALKMGRPLQKAMPALRSRATKFRPQLADRFLLEELPEIVPAKGLEKHRVGYFVGCISNFFLKDIALSAIETLSALGCDVVIPHNQVCCGAPAFNNGEMNAARKLARTNVDTYLKADVDIITSADATCGGSFIHEYNQLLQGDTDYERFSRKYREFNGLLLELLPADSLKTLAEKVTYHDSCHLRHTQGVRKAPRDILKRLPGIDFREMTDSEMCCGFGGSYSFFYAGDSVKISTEKITNARATGADTIACGSPGCILKLKEEAKIKNIPIQVKHIAQLIRERL
jgi:glycolate oxidase iron-sulfur subunit